MYGYTRKGRDQARMKTGSGREWRKCKIDLISMVLKRASLEGRGSGREWGKEKIESAKEKKQATSQESKYPYRAGYTVRYP